MNTSNKTPLLLLHGAIGSATQFDPFIQYLEFKHELLILNFSGHGGEAIPEADFSIQRFAQDVITFLDKKQITSIDVLGYSMGGYVALYLARFFPQYINRVMALSTKFEWNEVTAEQESRKLVPEKIEEKIPEFANLLALRHHPQDWKSILRKTAHMMLDLGKSPALSTEDYQQIKHHVLLALGKDDKMITLNETKVVAELLPNCILLLLENTPHPIEQMKHESLSKKVIAFFDKKEGIL